MKNKLLPHLAIKQKELLVSRMMTFFEYLDEHNLENGPGGRFVRAGEGGSDSKSGTGPGSGAGGNLDSTVSKLLADNPQKPGEAVFEYQSRIVSSLSPELKHEVLFRIREKPDPVGYIADGASRYRAENG